MFITNLNLKLKLTWRFKKQITSQNTKIEELNLSEILFENKLNKNFNDLKSKIYSEIKKSGFEAAASIYSISESKNFGGNLGWIKSNQISKEIYDQINSGKKLLIQLKQIMDSNNKSKWQTRN